MADILVNVLHHRGEFSKSSLGALSAAAALAARLGGEAHAVVAGGPELTDSALAPLGGYGAAKVFRADAPAGVAQVLVDIMYALVSEHGHRYALLGGGVLGFEIGAGLAARSRAGLVVEVTALRAEDGELVAERAILGDSQLATARLQGGFGVIVGRVNAFDAVRRETPAPAEVVDVDVTRSPWAQRIELVSRGVQPEQTTLGIEDADVLVSGGRGLGAAEGFALVEDLADALGPGSAVGATRAVVDLGWYPYSAQVGQTGKTVSPRLYVAAGISGAIQHKVGMVGSENIIAINRDPEAPIFAFSDLGVVGDVKRILPRLADAIRARKRR